MFLTKQEFLLLFYNVIKLNSNRLIQLHCKLSLERTMEKEERVGGGGGGGGGERKRKGVLASHFLLNF